MQKTKKSSLTDDSLSINSRWGWQLKMPVSDSDWNYETKSKVGNYKDTNVAYDMLCDTIS